MGVSIELVRGFDCDFGFNDDFDDFDDDYVLTPEQKINYDKAVSILCFNMSFGKGGTLCEMFDKNLLEPFARKAPVAFPDFEKEDLEPKYHFLVDGFKFAAAAGYSYYMLL